MAVKSLKGMAVDKDNPFVKKTDIFLCDPHVLVEEPGYNLRFEGEELEAHIEAITQHLMGGGSIPALEVVVTHDERIVVRDGHCRRRAVLRAIERGAEIPFVKCEQYRGGDADQVVLMITSSLGKALTVLETSLGYLRLLRFNWTEDAIAARVSKTRKHVEQMLVLATANTDVHELVKKGVVSATTAIDALNEFGEKAGEVLASKLGHAQANGKQRVTKGTLRPSLPPKVWKGVVDSFENFASRLDHGTRVKLAELEALSEEQIKGHKVEIDAGALLDLLKAQPALAEARAKGNAVPLGQQQSLEV